MTLEEKVNSGIKAAILAKDKVRLEALRAIKAAILIVKTSGDNNEFNTQAETKMLQKMVKQRRETAIIYKDNNRAELADKEIAEAIVIEEFLPKQMDEIQVREVIKTIINNTQASSAKDMGKVMGIATKQLAGLAEGKLISTLVKELLN